MKRAMGPNVTRKLRKVLIVDDHPLYTEALASALKNGFKDCEIFTAGSLRETFSLLDAGLEPCLLMLDLKLPDVTGISGFECLSGRLNNTRVLVISSLASAELVRELFDLGVMGFLPKESPVAALRHAVREVSEGRRYVPKELYGLAEVRAVSAKSDGGRLNGDPRFAHLTPQQTRILELICDGKPNKLIAYELSLAETTVKAHITALLRRLGVSNRTQAAVMVGAALPEHPSEPPEVRAFLAN